MIQALIINRIKKNAEAIAKFEKIRKANEAELARQAPRPKLQAPKWSQAEVAFMLSCD